MLSILRFTTSGRIRAQTIGAGIILLCMAAGANPEPVFSRADIRAAKPSLEEIEISKLPLKDYPLLSKFTRVKKIRLYRVEGSLATDDHLKALAQLNFTNLIYVNLNNCRLITDEGIHSLAKIRSLKRLQLEGTGITDAACKVLVSMGATIVNVANCTNVTKAGLSALANSDTLEQIRFSADKLTQDEVLTLIDSFKNLAWCEIIDPPRRLDANVLKAKGAERKIHVNVMAMGARRK